MYVNVVGKVRAAFETEEVVRLDCTHVGASDCKRIGVKLRVLFIYLASAFKSLMLILPSYHRNVCLPRHYVMLSYVMTINQIATDLRYRFFPSL